jgi:hypothetical protein
MPIRSVGNHLHNCTVPSPQDHSTNLQEVSDDYSIFVLLEEEVCESQWHGEVCWRERKLLVGPPMTDRSTGRGQMKCSTRSSRLGVGLTNPPRKNLLQNLQSPWRRSRPTQGCCASKEEDTTFIFGVEGKCCSEMFWSNYQTIRYYNLEYDNISSNSCSRPSQAGWRLRRLSCLLVGARELLLYSGSLNRWQRGAAEARSFSNEDFLMSLILSTQF